MRCTAGLALQLHVAYIYIYTRTRELPAKGGRDGARVRPRAHQKQLSSCRLPLLQVGAGVRPHQEQNRAVRVAAVARENDQCDCNQSI